jgi:hypothetical protein
MLLGIPSISIAADNGAEVQELLTLPERDRECFVHMHTTHGVAHQATCRSRRLDCRRAICGLVRSGGPIPEHPSNQAAQEPHAPPNDEEPEQKTYEASKKRHGIFGLGATLQFPPGVPLRGVYARGKGRVKRKGVISRGCGANRILPFWDKMWPEYT